ncbi:MAG: pyridoxal-dependent decarboxylase [Pseudomonadota bacterium]
MTRSLLLQAADKACKYLDDIASRDVRPDPGTIDAIAELLEPLPDTPGDDAAIIEQLDRIGSPGSMAMAGPRFFGFVIGGALPVTVASNWLATAWDQNSGIDQVTPVTSVLERIALDWLIDLFNLPADTGAGFVTGATVANFTALAAARHQVLQDAGWDVEADGLFGAPPIAVVTSEETHPSVTKSLGLLGLGRTRVTAVPTDGNGAMQVAAFPDVDGPTIVCTQVGNVNTGGSDPVAAICERVADKNAWVHVDGAFGLWLKASPSRRDRVAGLERAHSWATDAHKWLNVPYDSGIAFVRDANALRAAMSITAAYLPMEQAIRNPADFTPELSRRARGVDVWAAMKSLGRSGIAALIDRHCDQAQRFATGLAAAGFDILAPVTMNQVLVSFGDAATNQRVIEALQQEGTCWCGITRWQGKTAMRISVSNWSTTDADVDRSIEAMQRVARSLGAAPVAANG